MQIRGSIAAKPFRLKPRPRCPCSLAVAPQCDWAEATHLPALTSSRVGSIPVDEIDACMSASAAAVQEMAHLGPALAVPLLEYGKQQGYTSAPGGF